MVTQAARHRDNNNNGSASSSAAVSAQADRAKEVPWYPWTSTSDEALTWLGGNEVISTEELQQATAAADAKGIDHCIKDGPDIAIPAPSSEEDEVTSWDKVGLLGDESTDVETELGGIRRPQRGEGYWGSGPPLRIPRKGKHRDFVDGAGLCSPGQWPKDRRRLPGDNIAAQLQRILLEGLVRAEPGLPGGSFKSALAAIVGGKLTKSPFAERLIDEVRSDLRIALKKAGFGDGFPRAATGCSTSRSG